MYEHGERRYELVGRIREFLSLPEHTASDQELLDICKGTLFIATIELAMSLETLKKEILKAAPVKKLISILHGVLLWVTNIW